MKFHTVWFLSRWRNRVMRLADPAFAVLLGALCAYGAAVYLSR